MVPKKKNRLLKTALSPNTGEYIQSWLIFPVRVRREEESV